MAASSQGSQTRISFGAVGTAVGSFTEAHEIISETLTKKATILEDEGCRGTREHVKERTAEGVDHISGDIVMECYPASMTLMLPRILGGSVSANVCNPADTLPAFDVLIDRVAKRFTYGGCIVSKARFESKPNGRLRVTLSILGKSETVSATAFPSITIPVDLPYTHSQGVITLNSAVRDVTEFMCEVDNFGEARFTNSKTATDIATKDRKVSVVVKAPYTSDNVDLYGNSLTGSGGTMVYTNGSSSFTITFGYITFEDESPNIPGKSELFLPLKGVARKTGSTPSISITNVP